MAFINLDRRIHGDHLRGAAFRWLGTLIDPHRAIFIFPVWDLT